MTGVFLCFIHNISVSVLEVYQSLCEFWWVPHDTSLNAKAVLLGLNFKYSSDIKMAKGLLMVYTAFLSVSDTCPASRVLSPVF